MAVHLLDDVLLVIVAQRPGQLVVRHPVVLVLPEAPQPGYLLRLQQHEFAASAGPLDDLLMPAGQQQVEQKAPQGEIAGVQVRRRGMRSGAEAEFSREVAGFLQRSEEVMKELTAAGASFRQAAASRCLSSLLAHAALCFVKVSQILRSLERSKIINNVKLRCFQEASGQGPENEDARPFCSLA